VIVKCFSITYYAKNVLEGMQVLRRALLTGNRLRRPVGLTPLEKDPSEPIGYETGWNPELVRALR